MLTFDKVIQTDFGSYVRGFCLPTDEKPVTGIANGSMLEEINPESGVVDTYRFDGENAEWVKIISDGTPSGGGGGGGSGALIVHDTDGTLDKTWAEINAAAPLVWELAAGGDYPGGDYRPLVSCGSTDGGFYATFVSFPNRATGDYITYSEDGYPVFVTDE